VEIPLLLPPDGGEIGFDVEMPLLLPPDGGEYGFDVEIPLLLPPDGFDVDTALLPQPPPLSRSIAALQSTDFFDQEAPLELLTGATTSVFFLPPPITADFGGPPPRALHTATAALRISVSEFPAFAVAVMELWPMHHVK
jgi:hypothetical protein